MMQKSMKNWKKSSNPSVIQKLILETVVSQHEFEIQEDGNLRDTETNKEPGKSIEIDEEPNERRTMDDVRCPFMERD